jgi:hypothetical protein
VLVRIWQKLGSLQKLTVDSGEFFRELLVMRSKDRMRKSSLRIFF